MSMSEGYRQSLVTTFSKRCLAGSRSSHKLPFGAHGQVLGRGFLHIAHLEHRRSCSSLFVIQSMQTVAVEVGSGQFKCTVEVGMSLIDFEMFLCPGAIFWWQA